MDKLKAGAGLAIVMVGIWVFELEPITLLSIEEQKDLERLWDYHDKFKKVLGWK